ncbi:Bax inhibitor-1/YccA family protein [Enterococcus sp. LJL99]
MNNSGTVKTKSGINQFYSKIYGYLALGVGLSAVVSYLALNVFYVEFITFVRNFPLGFMGMWLVEIALVFFLASKAAKADSNPGVVVGGFIAYSIMNGATLAITLLYYTDSEVFGAFLASAATFGAMALVGMFTKKDLSGIGRAALSALIGVFIAILLNAFLLHSGPVDYLISILMVLIFSGLTAYDNQQIQNYYVQANGSVGTGIAVFFALQLYLDFINLFLAFLRIFGKNN